jgi:hypothetical protein
MFAPRAARTLTVGLALTGGICLLGASAASAAAGSAQTAANKSTILFDDGRLTVQEVNGFVGASGSAADVAGAAAALNLVGIGNTEVYSGPGWSGKGFLIVTGNGVPAGTTFQVLGLNAAGAADNSDESDVFYKLTTGERGETVPAGQSADLEPDGTVFAAYPAAVMPPPNDRGLDPVAQFVWQ